MLQKAMEHVNSIFEADFKLKRQEGVAINLLGWSTSVTPPSDFLALYFAKGVAFEDETCRRREGWDQKN